MFTIFTSSDCFLEYIIPVEVNLIQKWKETTRRKGPIFRMDLYLKPAKRPPEVDSKHIEQALCQNFAFQVENSLPVCHIKN